MRLACGRTLAPVEVAYTTVGTLNADASNAVFVCHALTGDAVATGPEGWWSTMVGPGKAIDTNKLFVITPNLLGGCRGTTGPSSDDPRTGNAYGLDFPPLAIADLVQVHRRLLQHLGVEKLHTAIGGSMGGMQVLQWLLEDHAQIERAVMICASPRLTAQNLALSHVARRAILDDPDFHDGQYLRHGTRPARGLATARRLAHVTYLSEDGMAREFDRGRALAPVAEAISGVEEPPGPDEVRVLVDAVLTGVVVGDFADTLFRASAFARVAAAGRAQAETEGSSYPNDLSASRLLVLSEQLGQAAQAELARSLG